MGAVVYVVAFLYIGILMEGCIRLSANVIEKGIVKHD